MEARAMKVIEARLSRSPSQLEEAYDLFRLEKQGALLSPRTLEFYDLHLGSFFRWLAVEAPEVRRFDQLDVNLLRRFKAEQASRVGRHGRRLQPASLHASHRSLRVFLRWAEAESYSFDLRVLRLPAPRLPCKEMTVYHIAQVRQILAACHTPAEDLAVWILVGAGLRMGELCGLALRAPDGLSDLMIDSIDFPQLLIHSHREPYETGGIHSMMNRLQARVGFRVHAHAFRHTFATIAAKMGWNFEHLRAAMGHSEYGVLQRYVRLATERDLGSRRDWADLIADNPAGEWK
jgi:site-specific recombinase XerD